MQFKHRISYEKIKRKKGNGKRENKQTCVQNLSKPSRLKEYIVRNIIQKHCGILIIYSHG